MIDGPLRARRVTAAYLTAKDSVLAAGFEHEIAWQESRSIDRVSEQALLAEAAWTILSVGLSEHAVRAVFPRISLAFLNWESSGAIVNAKRECLRRGKQEFRHARKLHAIVTFAEYLNSVGLSKSIAEIRTGGVPFLQQFPFFGVASAAHLAKNLGIRTAKPDRHLVRIACAFRYESPNSLCSAIAEQLAESPAVVDLVLWRFATIQPQYLDQLLEAYWNFAASDSALTRCPVAARPLTTAGIV